MQYVFRMFKVAVLCFFVCMISFNLFVNRAMAAGQFSQTCFGIDLNGATLTATCEQIDGSLVPTKIDLDSAIGNLDGTLSWGDYNFSQTCDDVGLSQSLFSRTYVLNANCKRRDQSIESTEIDLDDHIANIGGTLTFE